MKIEIPGYHTLEIEHLLLDYNGTIAEDGVIRRSVRDLLLLLSTKLDLHVLTADTHGTAKAECEGISLHLDTFPSSDASAQKLAKLQELGPDRCACIGNGRNDLPMLTHAAFAVAVMDREGLYSPLLTQSDLCVRSSEEALEMFLYPKRIIAGLRG
nr:HAD hydrolase family protein [uncultured Sellimonas sp.]